MFNVDNSDYTGVCSYNDCMTRLKESQRRYLDLFSEYVDVDSGRILDEEFKEDIKALHDKMPVFSDLDNLEEESKRSTSDRFFTQV